MERVVKLFNTYSRQKEDFYPLYLDEVRLYTCGPTVYDYVHIGNLRTFIFEDLLRRSLELLGFRVTQVMNLTDVEDKIIKASQEGGVPIDVYTTKYIQAFFEDIDTLKIERAEHYPRATEHIPQMISLIQTLKDKGFAYQLGDSVYYDISKFPRYGMLSRIKPTSSNAFSRLEADEYAKEEFGDFALWKGRKEGEPYWESPFGPGRPGWHIECSAMSMYYLGETLDIHTGGVDNIFPHHENEIAQSEAATGKTFVRYWLHSQHLMVNGERMAKSKGNFYTLRDLLAKGYSPQAIRFLLISTHYRNFLNFTFEALEQAEKNVSRIQDFYFRLQEYKRNSSSDSLKDSIERYSNEFKDALADDLNISEAISTVFSFMHEVNPLLIGGGLSASDLKGAIELMRQFDSVLAILKEEKISEDWILELIKEREKARAIKDFTKADEIRAQLEEKGIILEDIPQGTRWRKK